MSSPSTDATGFAGRLAAAFINSKLTPLGILASLLLGFLAIVFATINVVGGFLVTHRMLAMFQKK